MGRFRSAGSIGGAIALAVFIFFAGPMMAFGTARPLGPLWVRIVLAAVLVGIALGVAALKLYRKRKAAKQLESGIAESKGPENDAPVLNEKMKDALTTLRKAHGGRGDYLYDLPWYLLIGPPGSGKTTALVNSGLKFPLARGNASALVEGVGGTRYCDWWFTEDAVLIDTAGRYAVQESDAKGDRQSWLAFLDLLRKNRPKQPINGVILGISLEDLLTLPEAEIQGHADAIHSRLVELHERLKVDFPVYAVFTKADLVAGFMEYFGDMREAERRIVWGATFQTDDKTRNMIGEVPVEFDALVERLNEGLPDRLQEQPDHRARVLLFGLPAQMMALKRPIVDFLNRIFETTRYHANATLRGFYFTSGTQHGAPIDQLIGKLARTLEVEQVAPTAYSGLGKSFFLNDLLVKVIIGEAGWVSTNRAAARWSWAGRIALYSLLVAFAAGCVGLWWVSYVENRNLIARVNQAAVGIGKNKVFASLLQQQQISEDTLRKGFVGELGNIYGLLNAVRNMAAGYGTKDTPIPIWEKFGLSQRRRLEAATKGAYQRVLERTFRTRLLLRLEDQLRAKIDDPAYVYEALKVYRMLGLEHKSDDELIAVWMRRDWGTLFPGKSNEDGRSVLEQHLRSMLTLDEGLTAAAIQLNGTLIENGQKTLARMRAADRAYALLKSQAQTSAFPDWVLAEHGGADLAAVFETKTDEEFDQLRVPGFFTYEGFRQGYLAHLGDIVKRIEEDEWVLGDVGNQAALTTQYATLQKDLLDRYSQEFIGAWDGVLKQLQVRPLAVAGNPPDYPALSAASGQISPIRKLLESIRVETQLTRKPPEEAAAEGGAAAPAAALGEQVDAAAEAALGLGSPESAGTAIENHFKGMHDLVAGEPAEQPINALINALLTLRDRLRLAAYDPVQAQQATPPLPQLVSDLRTTSSRLPSPFAEMFIEAATKINEDLANEALKRLSQTFDSQVTRRCEEIISGRYPFDPKSARDVPLRDFADLFGPNGIIDGFFKQNLEPLVDNTKPQWAWRTDKLAQGRSQDTLRQFQRAAAIRDAFFENSGGAPSISFTVTPVTVPEGVEAAVLKINGTKVESAPGVTDPAPVEWPGDSPDNLSGVALRGGSFGLLAKIDKPGAWGFFHLIDAAQTRRQGDSIIATFKLEGQEVVYRFDVNAIANPFLMDWQKFRCPAGL